MSVEVLILITLAHMCMLTHILTCIQSSESEHMLAHMHMLTGM